MAERDENIRKRRLARRRIQDSDEEGSVEFASDLSPARKRGKTPYRKLTMQQDFTPPRKKAKTWASGS